MKFHLLFIVFILCMSFTCDTDDYSPCEDIRKGLVQLDVALAKPAIDVMLDDLNPEPTTQDPIGHEENLSLFVELLNIQCSVEASIECYGCIETFPVLSHILVSIDSAGISVIRILDIKTPADSLMTLKEIHH